MPPWASKAHSPALLSRGDQPASPVGILGSLSIVPPGGPSVAPARPHVTPPRAPFGEGERGPPAPLPLYF